MIIFIEHIFYKYTEFCFFIFHVRSFCNIYNNYCYYVFYSSPLAHNFFALLTFKVTEMRHLIFGKCSSCFLQLIPRLNKIWTPFWVFSIRCTLYIISTRLSLPNLNYWKKLKGAIGNSLLSHYIIFAWHLVNDTPQQRSTPSFVLL